MPNDPLDPEEAPQWERGVERDARFHPAMRLGRILSESPARTLPEVRRLPADWYARVQPVCMAVSLPDTFQFPEESACGRVFAEAVLPSCREFGIPLSLMIGVRRQVNPALRLAGDVSGLADLRALERLCAAYPENRFLASVLSRENQHARCVYSRKFSNLPPFGCWWFLNNPSMVEEITAERLENARD
jgi:hypothetical protein